MLDLSPLQIFLLAIAVPPFLIILSALGWQRRHGRPRDSPTRRRPLDVFTSDDDRS